MSKKILTLAAAVVMCLGLAVPAWAAEFSDVPAAAWYHSYVSQAAEEGWVSGYEDGTYRPGDPVSYAQFSVMVTQAFFRGRVEGYTGASSPWYLPYTAVADGLGLFQGTELAGRYTDKTAVGLPLNRYEMGQILYNTLTAAGVEVQADLARAEAETSDWSAIPAGYRTAVAAVKAAGLITGTDETGRFDGQASMSRAQAAVVMAAANQAILDAQQQTPADLDPPLNPNPVTPDPVAPGSSLVGTMSDTPVTLSLETHAPVVDYWTSQSAEVKALVDQRVFNAAVQSMKDAEMVIADGRQGTTWKDKAVNPYYNYATCDPSSNGVSLVANALGSSRINAYDDCFYSITYNVTKNVYTPVKDVNSDRLSEVFAPIFARFPANATDRQKVEICMKEIADRFDYKVGGGFTWWSDRTEGACESYARATQQILAAAGIPNFYLKGHAWGTAHAWNLALVDGEWYYIDGTVAESFGEYGPYDMNEFEEDAGVGLSQDTKNWITVFKALVETALS